MWVSMRHALSFGAAGVDDAELGELLEHVGVAAIVGGLSQGANQP